MSDQPASPLRLADVERIVATVTYKAGVWFEVEDRFGVVLITLRCYTLDSRAPVPPRDAFKRLGLTPELWAQMRGTVMLPSLSGRTDFADTDEGRVRVYNLGGSTLSRMTPVPAWVLEGGETRFREWFRESVIVAFEMHEVDEWLRFDGKQLRDPHAADQVKPRPLKLFADERDEIPLSRRMGRFVDYPILPPPPGPPTLNPNAT